MSLAWANKQIDYFGNLTFFERHKNALFFAGAVLDWNYTCLCWIFLF